MSKEDFMDFMSTLNKNSKNSTIEVLDYECMKSIDVKENFQFTILKCLKF